MAKIIFELGDIVSDADAQFGVVITPNNVLVMVRKGSDYFPEVRSTSGFLPIHQEAEVSTLYVRTALLAVIVALGLPDGLSKTSVRPSNLRVE